MEQAIRSLGFANAGQDTFTSEDSSYANVCQHDYFYLQGAKGNMLVVSDASGNLSGDGSGNLNVLPVNSP